MSEVQCHLDREGASTLVMELVTRSAASHEIFTEAVQLGIALLEGGNPDIQRSMFTTLIGRDSTRQAFFKVRGTAGRRRERADVGRCGV